MKTATLAAIPLWTRSAASSAPAPEESSDMTMMSAGATGSLTTSAHPAARRTGSRTERTKTMAAAANAGTINSIAPHLGRRGVMLDILHPALFDIAPVRSKSIAMTEEQIVRASPAMTSLSLEGPACLTTLFSFREIVVAPEALKLKRGTLKISRNPYMTDRVC
jgi:hypothetical protein